MMSLPPSSNEGEVKLVSACPLCRRQYRLDDAYIIDQKQGAYLLHTECNNCGSSIVAALVAGQHAVSSMGLVTDLTSEDVNKFKDSKEVDCDDVIDCHAWLYSLA